MPHPEPVPSFEPGRPALVAGSVFLLAMLALCWPMFTGQFLYGSDQLVTGYAFRHFGTEYFKAHGAVPQWNPYIFGGLPFIGAMHGDIFYPAAWLRLVFREDLAMTLAYAIHFVVAGGAMYAFLRALRVTWTGAVVGGLAYQMSGIVASLASPGHDGKLFVSALAPLFFLAVLRAVRDGRAGAYGAMALLVGLCLLSPHYQLTYYLLVAGGFWTLYLTFVAEDRRPGLRWPLVLGAALGAVLLGVAISAVQALPFLANMPFGARGTGAGWEYATAFSLPIEELASTVLPEFNGTLSNYWGQNFFKLHTEYLGVIVVLLAALGLRDQRRGRLRWGLLVIGAFFLLVALGGHTPFYRLWYEVMPLMKKVRAAGMAFFLVAFVVAVFAAFGVERLERREVTRRALGIGFGILGVMALMGATGLLQTVAESLAPAPMMERVAVNAEALQGAGVRMLFVVIAGGVITWLVSEGRLKGVTAAALLVLVVMTDLWSVDRKFFEWNEPASELFAEDALVRHMQETKGPYRVMNLPGRDGVYQGGTLMTWDVPQVFGYHGNEMGFYDQLWGGKNIWANRGSGNLWDLYAVRYLLLPDTMTVPGFHLAEGPAATAAGLTGVLVERDSAPPYARVVGAAAKVPDAQIIPTLVDRRFPVRDLVLFPDSSTVPVEAFGNTIPAAPGVSASVPDWEPGRMTVTLAGSAAKPTYLVVSENWHPDWHATVDGNPAAVYRGNQSMLAVVLPPGAREVMLEFSSPSYRAGKLVTLVATLLAFTIIIVPALRRRGVNA